MVRLYRLIDRLVFVVVLVSKSRLLSGSLVLILMDYGWNNCCQYILLVFWAR